MSNHCYVDLVIYQSVQWLEGYWIEAHAPDPQTDRSPIVKCHICLAVCDLDYGPSVMWFSNTVCGPSRQKSWGPPTCTDQQCSFSVNCAAWLWNMTYMFLLTHDSSFAWTRSTREISVLAPALVGTWGPSDILWSEFSCREFCSRRVQVKRLFHWAGKNYAFFCLTE